MACRYTYKGKTYEAHEFDDILRKMSPMEARKFMPRVEGLPSAPFVGKTDAWVSLALKRMIRHAADNGFDGVAWTTGKQQADRYSLDQEANRVVVTPRWDARTGEKSRSVVIELRRGGTLRLGVNADGVIDNVTGPISGQHIEDKHLSDVIGKEMADRVMASDRATFEGEALRVGGKGMIYFYDEIVPGVARDILKKMGGGMVNKVSFELSFNDYLARRGLEDRGGRIFRYGVELNRPTVERQFADDFPANRPKEQPGFYLTPAMREKAAGGMPMFARSDDILQDIDRLGRDVLDLEDAVGRETKELQSLIDYGRRQRDKAMVARRIKEQERKIADTKKALSKARRDLETARKEVEKIPPLDDPRNQLSLFARAQDDNTVAGRVQKLKGSGGKFTERVMDFARSSRTFNWWWHKGVGTQLHKALIDKDFGRVFWKGQDFLNEFSRAALDAAEQAPSLLPKIEGFRDIPKTLTGGASKADRRAVAKAVLEGTLASEDGDPFKGRVWSDDDLRKKFALTAKQIRLYREARAAIDTSLDLLHASEVANLVRRPGGEFGAGLNVPQIELPGLPRALEMAKRAPHIAGEIVGDYLAAVAEKVDAELKTMTFAGDTGSNEGKRLKQVKRDLLDLATTLVDKQAQKDALKAAGYAPLQRFGEYSVSAYDGEGNLLYFSLHESQREANAVKREIEAMPEFEDATVAVGVKAQNSYQLYRGLTTDTLELFAHTVGVGEDSVFQTYLKVAKNSRSAMKRLIHRKAVPGFQTDVTRTLAAFLTSNARAVAGNWHMADLVESVERIPKRKGDVADEATALVDYLQNPKEEAAFFRSLLFVNYLGGSLAAGLVNMTQPLTMTLPYLGQWGNAQASKELTVAMVDAGRDVQSLDDELAAALHRGIEEGIVAPHEVHQLHAEAIRNLGSNLAVRRLLAFWGSFFSATESFNRRVTFIAAYRTAKRIGAPNPYRFATRAIHETQGIYNRGNRPDWARGPIGATVMTFKQFSLSYLELLKRLPTRQRLVALAILFMLSGLQGLPFAEDLEDILDTIAQRLGYSWNTRQQARAALTRFLGARGGEFVMHGASHLPGVPLDVQGRIGMGNLIPGSSAFKVNADTGREVAEALGPASGFVKGVAEGAAKALQGDFSGAADVATPLAVKNVLKAVEMWQTGLYKDSRGGKVMEVDKLDAVTKGIGFQPTRVARQTKKTGEQMQNIQLHRVMEDRIADKMAQARFELITAKSAGMREAAKEKAAQARRDLTKWNLKNPDAKIVIEPAQIARRVETLRVSRDERIVKRAPKEIRRDVQRGLE